MKRNTRKLLSTLLALVMLLTAISVAAPMSVSAAYGDQNGDYTTYPDTYPKEKIVDMTEEQISEVVEAIIRTMKTDEFYRFAGGASAGSSRKGYGTGYHAGLGRLGVPVLRMYDGPQGVISQSGNETTKPISEEGLVSTWSRETAYKFGAMNAAMNKSIAGNVQLGTQYDNVRYPFYQRSRDTLGEDWYLTGEIGVQETKALQENNVMATLKHFAVYSGGSTAVTRIDEQTMHELYLSGFEKPVKEGNASAIMSSYNVINDIYASANMYIQYKVAREWWGFDGVFMTDWAMGNQTNSAFLGTDLEMPSISRNSATAIDTAISSGLMKWSQMEDIARHYLTALGEIGYLGLCQFAQYEGPNGEKYIAQDSTRDVPGKNPTAAAQAAASIEMPDPPQGQARIDLLTAADKVALESAEKGAVLLKNNAGALPLKASDGSIALIGLTTKNLVMSHHSECSFGWLPAMTSVGEELPKILTANNINSYVGIDTIGANIPAQYLFTDAAGTTNGVVRTGTNEKGETVDVIDPDLNYSTNARSYFNAAGGRAFPNGSTYTVTTYLKAPTTGQYTLRLTGMGGALTGNCTITIDGANTNISSGMTTLWATTGVVRTNSGMNVPAGTNVNLVQDTLYRVTFTVRATQALRDCQANITWQKPGDAQANLDAAVAAASTADTVVYCPYSLAPATNLDLDAAQKSLMMDVLNAAKAAGKKTVVVLTTAMPLVVSDWIDKADAILCMWLPGQTGGRAMANILSGVTNPSGKTAVTWPKNASDTQMGVLNASNPNYADMYTNNKYKEGIFSGYRWYDAKDIEPQFAFGFGLSYAKFEYSGLQIKKSVNPQYGYGYDVTFTVKNTGTTVGSEVAEVYLGAATIPNGVYSPDALNWSDANFPSATNYLMQNNRPADWSSYIFPSVAGPQMAKKQLAAFDRIENLAPGASKTVTVKVEARALCYWDARKTANGAGTVYDKWVLAPGKRDVLVGASSRDIRLENKLDVDPVASPYSKIEVAGPETVYTNIPFQFTVTTDLNAIGLNLLNESGKTIGITGIMPKQVGKKLIWTVTTAIGTPGLGRKISIQVKTLINGKLSGWIDSGASLVLDVVDQEAAVNSVTFSKVVAAVNEDVTTTIITNLGAKSLMATNENGSKMGMTLVTKTQNANGTITWVYTMKFGSKGIGKAYKFAAAGSDKVYTDKTFIAVIHIV